MTGAPGKALLFIHLFIHSLSDDCRAPTTCQLRRYSSFPHGANLLLEETGKNNRQLENNSCKL